ncbi:MAG: AsmA family protein, partial [Rhodospirillaceae bacterium]|nr:AsmA family protein [Rhodospirillaceae bacterium]
SLNSELLSLSGINISIDRSLITGGVSLALSKRLSFGANLNIDSINLDSYLKKTASTSSVAGKKTETKNSTTIADAASAWSALRALNDFDANAKLKVGSLTQGGNVYKNLAFDGTIYAGTLEIRDARLGSFAGSSGVMKGKINGFGGVPEMTGVSLSLTTNDVATLSRRLGVSAVPAKIGAAKINAKVNGSLLKPKMDISVKSMGGDFSANGGLSFLPFSFGFDGNASIKHSKPTEIFSALGLAYNPKGPIRGMDLGFAIKTDGKEHSLSKISGTLDGTSIAGNANITTGGSKTDILASLQTGDLYIEHFMPRDGGSKSAARKQKLMPGVILASWNQPSQPVEIAQSPTSRASKRWSRDDIGLSVLNTINADVTLTSSSVFYGKHKLNNADIHATVKDGVLTADRINATAYGGPIRGAAVVRATGQPTIDAKLKINGLDVGAALMAASNQSGVKGGLDFDLGFKANGNSAAELVSSLSGAGGLNISSLDVKRAGAGNALSGVIGLVAAMNQLAIPMPGASGGPQNGLAEVKVGFDIKDGLATLSQATISSNAGNGKARGTIDIAAWDMNVSGLMSVEANLVTALLSQGKIGRQEVPFTLKGALDSPGINFGIRPAPATAISPTTGEAAPAPAAQKPKSPQQLILEQILGAPKQPAPAPAPVQQPQPQPERQVKPEEIIIRGIMDGLFKR